MNRLAFLIPGDIGQPSGGYGYARAVIACWRAAGVTVDVVRLGDDYPRPSAATLDATADQLAQLPSDRPVLFDGLAFGALPTSVLAACAAPITVLLHHPLGLETGLAPAEADRMIATERAATAMARHVVVTSPQTARTVEELFDIPPERITVALPGTPARAAAQRSARPPRILSVGSLTPRKGHADLVRALAAMADRDWQCDIAGSFTADPETTRALRRQIATEGLEGRITLHGGLSDDAIQQLYQEASLFALPSYYEGYGMAFAEALSYGLPVVGYHAGAVPDVVPASAGMLAAPGDVAALTVALAALLGDEDKAFTMAEAAHQAGRALPTWQITADIILKVLAPAGQSAPTPHQETEG
jgi:glycosyltransferase involved in cell wall biosynthesis